MFPETLIRVFAKPVTVHRAVFDEIYEVTGKPYTSVWYATPEEVVQAWSERDFERIESADARISVLTEILDRLKASFDSGGSEAVTLELEQMEREHNELESRQSWAMVELTEDRDVHPHEEVPDEPAR